MMRRDQSFLSSTGQLTGPPWPIFLPSPRSVIKNVHYNVAFKIFDIEEENIDEMGKLVGINRDRKIMVKDLKVKNESNCYVNEIWTIKFLNDDDEYEISSNEGKLKENNSKNQSIKLKI
jgi:hypothetical protein